VLKKGKDSITLVAVGGIRLARKDYKLSFLKVAQTLRSAEISFFNCDTVYAENGTCNPMPFYQRAWRDKDGNVAAPNDPKKMAGLALAGFNVCTLANNQTLDWGGNAALYCRELLEAMGIAVCGFGRDMAEARQPAIVEKHGIKIAFLGYLSVGPEAAGHYDFKAESDKAGVAVVRAHTVYAPYDLLPGTLARILTYPYKEDLHSMVEDIKKARGQADIVVVTNHWGIHTPVVIPDYEWEVGHAAIDAGADLVLGTRPQVLKGIEVYKGKVIIHSLGNFALEEEIGRREGEPIPPRLKFRIENEMLAYGPRSPDDQKSIIVKCVISGKKIERASYIPIMLEDDVSPEPLPHSDPRSEDVVKYMEDITRAVGLDTKFSWEGDEVVIGL
jgi:poly-gamma-glutamate synthesis protein (capsule biosynthesis protein)